MNLPSRIAILTILWVAYAFTPSALADGFEDNNAYKITQGDFDGDGDLDFYLKEKPVVRPIGYEYLVSIALPPSVVPFVLLQGPGKTFSIDSDLSGLNLSIGQASSVGFRALDVNLDGRTDGVITNLASAIAGAKDQIIYASSTPGDRNSPILLRPIDAALKSFINEVNGWFEDTNYFEITAWDNGWYELIEDPPMLAWWAAWYLQSWGFTLNGQLLVQPNEDPFNPSVAPASCSWGQFSCRYNNGQWELLVQAWNIEVVFDYSHFNAQARALAQEIQPSFDANNLVAGSTSAEDVSDTLEGMFGSSVFQNALHNPQTILDVELEKSAEPIGELRLDRLIQLLKDLAEAVAVPVPPEEEFVKMTGVDVIVRPIERLPEGDIGQVNAIVLHRTDGSTLAGAYDWAKKTGTGTHFYVDPNGEIYQAVSMDKWSSHANPIKSRCLDDPTTCTAQEHQAAQAHNNGEHAIHAHERNKSYPDRYPISQDSIGIEVVADHKTATGWPAPTAAQVEAVGRLVEALKQRYTLDNDDVYGHDDIAKQTAGEGSNLGYD